MKVNNKSILVIGDVFLDIFGEYDAIKISPEAPIPVIRKTEEKFFIGGAIAPGIEVAAQNLIKRAALLTETAFVVPKITVGKSTDSNLQSGIMLGAIDVIDGMFQRILTEMGWENGNIIVTGGFGELISPHLLTKHTLLPTLTLDGIRIIYEKSS